MSVEGTMYCVRYRIPFAVKNATQTVTLHHQVSSSFAAVASSSKEGEGILDAKLSGLEQRLMDAQKEAQASQVKGYAHGFTHGFRH